MSVFVNALLNTIVGMGTVFVVLIFISLIISLFVNIPRIEERLKSGKVKEAPVATNARPVIIEEEEEEELVGDEELVAVIMAAIMAYQGNTTTASADKLVVRSIKRARGRR